MISTPMTFEADKNTFLTRKNKYFLSFVRKMESEQLAIAALKDMENIKNGLLIYSLLKNENIYNILNQSISVAMLDVLKDTPLYLDHVGLEVFGSLTEYATILKNSILTQESRYKLFESVQFYEVLKKYDQQLKKIDILRINTEHNNNIELFSCHQHYSKTLSRESNFDLKCTKVCHAFFPLTHIAIRIEDPNIFKRLVQIVENDSTIDIFGEKVYYNPADCSYNIKLIAKKSIGHIEEIMQINFLEFISHS